jgi:OOP family OmpA-OmpF porin
MQAVRISQTVILATVLGVLSGASNAFADDHVHGVITDKKSGILLIQPDGASNLVVVVTDRTKVVRTDGFRERRMSSATLIPGLRVKVEGKYDTPERFIAEEVTFKRSDLKTALSFQATDQRSRANQELLEQHARALRELGVTLADQAATLGRHAAGIQANAAGIQANEEKIVATSGELSSRIGNLDAYTVIDSMTVHFRNGSAVLGPEYRARLKEFAAQAKNQQGYMVQVQGFASTPGTEILNTKLSRQRADAVVAVLQQNGVALTSIVVPAAIGETQQIASDATSKGQAENRRAIVTLLQNKGIAAK